MNFSCNGGSNSEFVEFLYQYQLDINLPVGPLSEVSEEMRSPNVLKNSFDLLSYKRLYSVPKTSRLCATCLGHVCRVLPSMILSNPAERCNSFLLDLIDLEFWVRQR